MRYVFRYEIEHLLVHAGLIVEQLFDDYEQNPYAMTYPGDLIFVARKSL